MNADYGLEPIAVVGLACRVPGAADSASFWRNLRAGVESRVVFERAEMLAAGADPAVLDHPDYVPVRFRLDGIENFDAPFFGFTPREAAFTDPQQRFFLETAWEALENAGYDPKDCRCRVGVFAGVGLGTYLLRHLLGNPELDRERDEYPIFIGNDKDFVPTRLSYLLNLEGPSLAVSTACSSSLVAVHAACQALLTYQCDLALAGAVSVRVPQTEGYLYQQGGILSPDGHCRAFAAGAAGTVGGSGVGLVVLKRLTDARTDGDRLRALLLATAINNDGAAKVGFTAPGVRGQAAVIADALGLAGVDPSSIGYVEAHGTGTALGDPVEVAALTEAFRKGTDRRAFCALGSVKTNLGHLDTAAGMAGLIKVVLALEHGELPPSLHFDAPNPAIDFATSPFFVNDRLRPWPGPGPRRAGVSSFGIGGTNAHVIVEAAPAPAPPNPAQRPCELVPLAARTPRALGALRARLAGALPEFAGESLADVAFTLQVGRHPLGERWAAVVSSADELAALLATAPDELPAAGWQATATAATPELAWLCAGQGATGGLGDLYATEPALRRAVDALSARLEGTLGTSGAAAVREAVVVGGGGPAVAMLALFILELALARLWASWGLRPRAVAGHSLGEVVAAVLGGVLDESDALDLVVERGRLVTALPAGGMVAVAAGEDAVAPFLGADVWLAAVNGPRSTVLTGTVAAVQRVTAELAAAGQKTRPLAVTTAFHSGLLDPLLGRFAERAARLRPRAPEIPWLSSVTGTWLSADEARDPGYWVRQLRQPVRFDRVLAELLRQPLQAMLELGPDGVLTGLARRHQDFGPDHLALSSLPRAGDPTPASAHLLRSLARLWLAGATVDWRGFQAAGGRRRVALPTYPFEPQRHWVERTPAAAPDRGATGPGLAPEEWCSVPSWQRGPALSSAAAGSAAAERWLLWLDDQGLGEALERRLRAAGHEVRTVRPGADFRRPDEASWELDVTRAAHYQTLAGELHGEGWVPRVVVHLGGVTAAPGPLAADPMLAAQDHGFHALVRLAQAFGAHGMLENLRLEVVTNGLVAVLAGDPTCPEKATLLGPMRVLPLEHPGVACRLLDLAFAPAGGYGDADVATLAAVLAEPGAGLTALRAGYRWFEAYERLRLNELAPGTGLRPRGVYLIAGGIGGIGYEIASYLARTVAARLVLTGRRELDGVDAPRAVHHDLLARTAAIGARGAEIGRILAIAPLDAHRGLRPGLEQLGTALALESVATMGRATGLEWAVGARHNEHGLPARLGIVPKLVPLFRALLEGLLSDGVLGRDGGDLVVLAPGAAVPAAAPLRDRLVAEHPGFAALIDLLVHCARNYPAAFAGEIAAIAVLYPDGTPDLLAKTAAATTEHTQHRRWLALLGELVGELVAAHPERRLRVLEIGGGNGVLTWPLLEVLRDRPVEYVFTDLGRGFVVAARERASALGLSGIQFRSLDISREPSEQGFAPGSFDLVLELDVIHATSHIATTLGHLKGLLRPGGALLAVETVRSERWSTMAYGLAEGWWLSADPEIRQPGSPLLALDAWEAAFERHGFAVRAFPAAAEERAAAECGLIVAQLPVPSAGDAPTDVSPGGDLERLRRLEAAGGEVFYRQADVADAAAMAAVVAEARQRFGRLDGVIHAAAVERRGAIQLRRDEDGAQEFAAKIRGTLVLDELCRAEPQPDFLLLSSSITAQLGGIGDVEYTAANSFVDAFAQARGTAGPEASRSAPWVASVAWDRWRGVGMARAFEARHELRSGESPLGGMSAAEGCAVFARLVGHRPASQVVVSTVDFEAWRRHARRQRVDELERRLVSAAAHDRPALPTGFAAPRTELEGRIAAVWCEVLGVREVGVADDFTELGGDSLIAIKVISRLREELGLQLTVRALFEARTVARLAEHGENLYWAAAGRDETAAPAGREEGGL